MTYQELEEKPWLFRMWMVSVTTDSLLSNLDLLERDCTIHRVPSFQKIYKGPLKYQANNFRAQLVRTLSPFYERKFDNVDSLAVADEVVDGSTLIDNLAKVSLQISELKPEHQQAFMNDWDILLRRYGVKV